MPFIHFLNLLIRSDQIACVEDTGTEDARLTIIHLINGTRLTTPYHHANHHRLLHQLSPENILPPSSGFKRTRDLPNPTKFTFDLPNTT